MTPALLKKYLEMKRLLIPLLAALALPTAVNAETVWLVLSRKKAGFEKIEMKDMKQCQEMRDYWWENGGNKVGAYSLCITGK